MTVSSFEDAESARTEQIMRRFNQVFLALHRPIQ
jgi:hypothetical protein